MRVRSFVVTVLAGVSAVAVPAAAMEVARPPRPELAGAKAPDRPAVVPKVVPALAAPAPMAAPPPTAAPVKAAPPAPAPKPAGPEPTVKPAEPAPAPKPAVAPVGACCPGDAGPPDPWRDQRRPGQRPPPASSPKADATSS